MYYIHIQHGNVPGRSYGFAVVIEGDKMPENTETNTYIGYFETREIAQIEANKENEFYNGSDYR